MRLLLSAVLISSAVAQEPPAALDKAALQPVLEASWATGESCEGERMDFAIDIDGQPYLRAPLSYTPLGVFTFKDGVLTVTDEVGIGRTTSVYRLGEDGSLRLWSETYDPAFGEEAQEGEPAVERVKDGAVVIGDDGVALSPGTPTPAMKPCPARTAMFPAETVAALDGAWATGDGKGSICAMEADSVTFQLSRPVPHVLRGPFGGEATSTSYAINIVREGDAYIVTEGGAFEANDFTFTPDGKGGLVQANPYADGPLELHRCP